MDLTLEELQAKLQESQVKIQALEQSKAGLTKDLVKRKGIERLVKAAGLDLSDDGVEDAVAALLASQKPPESAATGAPNGSAPQAPPAGAAPAGTPSSAVEEALRAELSSLKNQLNGLGEKLKNAEKEKEKERAARLANYTKSVVLQELEKTGCKRPQHVFALQGKNFRLLDDEETVVYGSEESPVNVSDAIANLEKDDEYSIYWPPGVQASGAGLPTSRSPIPVTDNPFTKSGANATRASEIITRDPALAKRLVQQARARGDVDPVLARHAMA